MSYNLFAEYYDQIFPFNLEQAKLIGELLSSESVVLELGCGSGDLCGYLSSSCRAITGVDLEQAMAKEAKRKYPACDFLCMDICDLDRLTQDFDVIFSVGNVLSYLNSEKLEQLVARVSAHLHPGGHWLYQIVNWDYFDNMTSYDFPVKETKELIFRRHYRFGENDKVAFNLTLHNKNGELIFDQTDELYRRKCQAHIELNAHYGLKLSDCWANWQKAPWLANKDSGMILSFTKNG